MATYSSTNGGDFYVDGAAYGPHRAPGGALATNAADVGLDTQRDMKLDEVAIYNRALTAAEVRSHYDAAGGGR